MSAESDFSAAYARLVSQNGDDHVRALLDNLSGLITSPSVLGFAATGKLRGAEKAAFQAAIGSYLSSVRSDGAFFESMRGENPPFDLLGPWHRVGVVADLAVGLLVPNAALPPETIEHHAGFLAMFMHLMEQIEVEIESELGDCDGGRAFTLPPADVGRFPDHSPAAAVERASADVRDVKNGAGAGPCQSRWLSREGIAAGVEHRRRDRRARNGARNGARNCTDAATSDAADVDGEEEEEEEEEEKADEESELERMTREMTDMFVDNDECDSSASEDTSLPSSRDGRRLLQNDRGQKRSRDGSQVDMESALDCLGCSACGEGAGGTNDYASAMSNANGGAAGMVDHIGIDEAALGAGGLCDASHSASDPKNQGTVGSEAVDIVEHDQHRYYWRGLLNMMILERHAANPLLNGSAASELHVAAQSTVCPDKTCADVERWIHSHRMVLGAGFHVDAQESFLTNGSLDLDAVARKDPNALRRFEMVTRRVDQKSREFCKSWTPEKGLLAVRTILILGTDDDVAATVAASGQDMTALAEFERNLIDGKSPPVELDPYLIGNVVQQLWRRRFLQHMEGKQWSNLAARLKALKRTMDSERALGLHELVAPYQGLETEFGEVRTHAEWLALAEKHRIWKTGGSKGTGFCAVCHRRPDGGQKLKVCGKCFQVEYCSREHQEAHWKTHKPLCKKWRAQGKGSAASFNLG